MPRLNLDILYEIVDQVSGFDCKNRRAILLSLALTCRDVNNSIRPILFHSVNWPHPDKFDQESGLLFFPEALWPYFKIFHFDWPDNWPDTSPPRWGTKPFAIYYPKHMDKIENALPKMKNIHTFQVTCPFDPPTDFLESIVKCPNIKDLKITDTPLDTAIVPTSPRDFNLEHMAFVSVAEAVRMGEGPYDKRFQNVAYFFRGYRKKYLGIIEGSEVENGHYGASRFFIALCRKDILRSLQISANYLKMLIDFGNTEALYPCLELLTLTGPTPLYSFDLSKWTIGRMPKLTDLRVLLCTTRAADYRPERADFCMILNPASADGPPTAYSQITSLAISNAYNTDGVLRYTTSLKRLAICTLVGAPRLPIALKRAKIEALLVDLEAGGGNENLEQIRLIAEQDLDSTFLERLGRICPKLETVEIERCGYQDAQKEVDWATYGDALSAFPHLKELRIAIPFLGCDELEHEHAQLNNNNPACVRADRTLCAAYLASRAPALRRIGFEYRARPAHRYEDRWLDFGIVRLRDGEVRLVELAPTWYPFPEVWEAAQLHE
ncbi:hypothetical protein BJ912DRAFT_852956 [Pholiota molesta]|nr:hypothetical protein BJ912DRAFT_852956 [Pholiota molesta]